jgi:hypothetical protein
MPYRRGAIFIANPREHSTPFDRNQRARIMFLAEQLELRSKEPGARCGALGLTGLAVLRALLRFSNGRDGLCCPSYTAIECATKLSRATIAACLKRLEQAGILRICRRLQRTIVGGVLRTVQATSLYSFRLPLAGRDYVAPIRVQRAAREPTQNKINTLIRSMANGLAMNVSRECFT